MKRVIRSAMRKTNRLWVVEMEGRKRWNHCNALAFDTWRAANQERREYAEANPNDRFRVVLYFSLDNSKRSLKRGR